jgi:hypothetical protein
MNPNIRAGLAIYSLGLALIAINTVEAESSPQPAGEGQKPATAKATAGKPNIVFILMDNLGYGEVGCYGGGITRGAPTPRIDKLATEGTRLTNFNVEAQCTPSRSAILTAAFPSVPAHIQCR